MRTRKRAFTCLYRESAVPDHTFRGFQGQIEAGEVKVGDEITTLPSNETAHVKSIHVGDKLSDSAFTGQPVTIQLDREVDVSRGCVLTIGSEQRLLHLSQLQYSGWMTMSSLRKEFLLQARYQVNTGHRNRDRAYHRRKHR